jgi:cytochrome c556
VSTGKTLLALATLAALGAGTATAQDIIAQRQEAMKGNGQQMNVIKGVVVDKQGTLADAGAAAAKIAATADQIPSWFPPGTHEGDTRALLIIWEQPDKFATQAQTMKQLAEQLAAAANSGDEAATAAAFGALGQSGCGGCHETFRRPQT